MRGSLDSDALQAWHRLLQSRLDCRPRLRRHSCSSATPDCQAAQLPEQRQKGKTLGADLPTTVEVEFFQLWHPGAKARARSVANCAVLGKGKTAHAEHKGRAKAERPHTRVSDATSTQLQHLQSRGECLLEVGRGERERCDKMRKRRVRCTRAKGGEM